MRPRTGPGPQKAGGRHENMDKGAAEAGADSTSSPTLDWTRRDPGPAGPRCFFSGQCASYSSRSHSSSAILLPQPPAAKLSKPGKPECVTRCQPAVEQQLHLVHLELDSRVPVPSESVVPAQRRAAPAGPLEGLEAYGDSRISISIAATAGAAAKQGLGPRAGGCRAPNLPVTWFLFYWHSIYQNIT